jgi:16S rRNA methyltransferase RsmB/F
MAGRKALCRVHHLGISCEGRTYLFGPRVCSPAFLRRPGDLTRTPGEQFQITRSAITLLKPGDVLAYSTCSLETEENEPLVERLDEFSADATYGPGILPTVSRSFRRDFCRAYRQHWVIEALAGGVKGRARVRVTMKREPELHLAWPMES